MTLDPARLRDRLARRSHARLVGSAQRRSSAARRLAARSPSAAVGRHRCRDLEASLGGEWRDERASSSSAACGAAATHGRDAVGAVARASATRIRARRRCCRRRAGAAAVRVLRSRDHRPERRRGHARVSRRLRLVRRRGRVRHAAVPADAATRTSGAMLDAVAAELARAGALVSFNGKSFDAPVLETRYLFHRLDVDRRASCRTSTCCIRRGGSGPRRTLRRMPAAVRSVTLEQQISRRAAQRRRAGFEIPRALLPVRPHAATRVRWRRCSSTTGSICCRSPGSPRACCTLVARRSRCGTRARARRWRSATSTRAAGSTTRARDAYRRAIAACRAPAGAFDAGRIGSEACARWRSRWRRARAATTRRPSCWQQLLEVPRVPARTSRARRPRRSPSTTSTASAIWRRRSCLR